MASDARSSADATAVEASTAVPAIAPSRWFTARGRAAVLGTVTLDTLASLSLTTLSPARMPAVLTDFLRLGGEVELRSALALVDHELVPLDGDEHGALGLRRRAPTLAEAGSGASGGACGGAGARPDGDNGDSAPIAVPGPLLTTVAEVEALADAVSRLVEPRPVPEGCTDEVCAEDGARRFVKRSGEALWTHIDHLCMARDMCRATARVLQRLLPVACALRTTAAASAAPASLDTAFLDSLRVAHTACDSGEEWMIPFELSAVADGSQNVFCIPDFMHLSPAHIAYCLRPAGSFNRRTLGRILIGGCVTAMAVPAHEIVHIVQHGAAQVDRSRNGGSAEHDACRLANPLFAVAMREVLQLSAAEAAAAAAAGPTGEAEAVAPLPPCFLLLNLLVNLRGALHTRASDAVDGAAFRAACAERYETTLATDPPASDGAAAAPAMSPVAEASAAAAAGVVPPSAAATPGAAAPSPSPSPGAAPLMAPLMALYLDWMRSFGLSNPMPELARLGGKGVTDETIKRLCTIDSGACAVRAGRAAEAAAAVAGKPAAPVTAEAAEGCVARHLTEDALVGLLHVCFAGRTGDVHSDANRARTAEAMRTARVPACEWDSLLELLEPCTCSAHS